MYPFHYRGFFPFTIVFVIFKQLKREGFFCHIRTTMDGVGSTASPATSGAGVAGASGKSSGEEVLDKKRLQVTSFTVLTGFLQHSTLN